MCGYLVLAGLAFCSAEDRFSERSPPRSGRVHDPTARLKTSHVNRGRWALGQTWIALLCTKDRHLLQIGHVARTGNCRRHDQEKVASHSCKLLLLRAEYFTQGHFTAITAGGTRLSLNDCHLVHNTPEPEGVGHRSDLPRPCTRKRISRSCELDRHTPPPQCRRPGNVGRPAAAARSPGGAKSWLMPQTGSGRHYRLRPRRWSFSGARGSQGFRRAPTDILQINEHT